ncbi:hypothetical protein AVEN_127332-1 [Araneus ventricosus]|uniref:Uncharacterized protein n=1 Tax=Araneus ventricosus TaxID=182803 RepID=A0A4Y2HZ04_ARAVE|nr:hypothetical protein AVEN_127332-1 [Araneus ventricosus]
MVKDHVIKYHKKPSPRLALAPGFPLNDWPPRLHRALRSTHNSPHLQSAHATTPPHYTGVSDTNPIAGALEGVAENPHHRRQTFTTSHVSQAKGHARSASEPKDIAD